MTKNTSLYLFEEKMKEISKNDNHIIYTLFNENINEIIGLITIFYEPKFIRNLKYKVHIEDVVIDKKWRRKGLGKLMLNEILSTIKKDKRKIYKISLNCNEKYKKFYEKIGFIQNNIEMSIYI